MKGLGLAGKPLFQLPQTGLRRYSIRRKIFITFFVITLGMTALNLAMLTQLFRSAGEYDLIVDRVARANAILPLTAEQLSLELWNTLVEKNPLDETTATEQMDRIRATVLDLRGTTQSAAARRQMEICARTTGTLERYVSQLLQQVREGAPMGEREKTIENVRGVAELVTDTLYQYISAEMRFCTTVNQDNQRHVRLWLVGNVAALLVLGGVFVFSLWVISNGINRPIDDLILATRKVAEGDFSARVPVTRESDEIALLASSFNSMIAQLQRLMDEVKQGATNLQQAELQLLQEQINPHFLYNTLETIIWMTETGDRTAVVELVRRLSVFFRTTLSQGQDMVPLHNELSHVESYLWIQKVRYKDILDYRIQVPEELHNCRIPKLSLQPLVENALYHGIKNKRDCGLIEITGERDGESILLMVSDDGAGMSAKRQHEVQARLDSGTISPSNEKGGVGLTNVQCRLRLYYGPQYGLALQSEEGAGTIVSIRVPCTIAIL